ncbi:unnamed protein product, partial [Mesorhabditis belari]|uniref:Uncharacterized protein n=1 Tax=Mesorhabditis belari TaxID=2138241 RepID=A0AAF3F052_9BILA
MFTRSLSGGCVLWMLIGLSQIVRSQPSSFSPLRPLLHYSESSKHYRDPALGPFILVTDLQNGRLGMFRDEKRHTLWNKREMTRDRKIGLLRDGSLLFTSPHPRLDRLSIDPFEGRIRSLF